MNTESPNPQGNQIALAAELALTTCPRTSRKAGIVYDDPWEAMSFEAMKSQLLDQASRVRAKLFVMIIQWSLTGKWPKFRDDSVYFLHEILAWSAAKKSCRREDDFPDSPPPWDAKYAAHFFDRTALAWFTVQSNVWARELASEEFDLHESYRKTHP